MNRLEMKEKAKGVIKGKVFFSFIVVFLYGLMMSIPNTLYAGVQSGKNNALLAVGSIISLVGTILLSPTRYGVILYFHNITNGREGKLEGYFIPYKEKFWQEMIKARLLANVYIFLGTICFIIPGIYMAFKYSQIEYCFLENKQMKYNEAMNRSAEIMKNNKMELFVLYLSFIGWFLLALLTFGLILIYVEPYIEATAVQFYYEKSGFSSSSNPEDIFMNGESAEEKNISNNHFYK
jgi:uncharacterized membrane protein